MNLRLSLICLFLVVTGCSNRTANQVPPAGQNGGSGNAPAVRTSADVVKVGGSGAGLSANGSADLPIPISIEPGYHVNANPATFEYLIATELTVDKSEGITFGQPIYPAAAQKKFQFADVPLAVYEGQVQIILPLKTGATIPKGKRTLAMSLRVQACDDEQCFPPDTLRLSPAVDVK